jgi:hypothetical protein
MSSIHRPREEILMRRVTVTALAAAAFAAPLLATPAHAALGSDDLLKLCAIGDRATVTIESVQLPGAVSTFSIARDTCSVLGEEEIPGATLGGSYSWKVTLEGSERTPCEGPAPQEAGPFCHLPFDHLVVTRTPVPGAGINGGTTSTRRHSVNVLLVRSADARAEVDFYFSGNK